MVMLGLLAIARVWWTVFSGAYGDEALVPHVLLWLGLATAAIGAVMAFLQRHLKRLLAYSTISHAGVVLAGIAVLAPKGLAGAAVMVLGHGLLKASLFLAGGVLLQRFRAIDELKLRGRGRELRVLGGLFMLAAVGLIGLPYVGTFMGHSLIDDGATEAGQHLVGPILMITAGISAGAIMRAGARIFYGWGAAEDPLLSMEPDEEPDSREASLPVMVSVIGVLVVLGFVTSVVPGLQARAEQGASRFEERQAYASEVLHGAKPVPAPRPPYSVGSATAESVLFGLGAGAIAVITMAFGLWRSRLPRRFREAGTRALEPPLQVLRDAHSGIVGDYVTWLVLGTAGLAAVFALAAR
jgi:multicomponent Na+:H+ antiporter subunit D